MPLGPREGTPLTLPPARRTVLTELWPRLGPLPPGDPLQPPFATLRVSAMCDKKHNKSAKVTHVTDIIGLAELS